MTVSYVINGRAFRSICEHFGADAIVILRACRTLHSCTLRGAVARVACDVRRFHRMGHYAHSWTANRSRRLTSETIETIVTD